MKMIIGLSVILGFFFGLMAFIIIAIFDSAAFALPMGLIAGVLFGVPLAIILTIHNSITNKKYFKYKEENIPKNIVCEGPLFRLNGNAKDAGYLFLTDEIYHF